MVLSHVAPSRRLVARSIQALSSLAQPATYDSNLESLSQLLRWPSSPPPVLAMLFQVVLSVWERRATKTCLSQVELRSSLTTTMQQQLGGMFWAEVRLGERWRRYVVPAFIWIKKKEKREGEEGVLIFVLTSCSEHCTTSHRSSSSGYLCYLHARICNTTGHMMHSSPRALSIFFFHEFRPYL